MTRLGRRYWQSTVGKFDKSALSQEAFCDAHGLTLGTFRSWLYRLRRERREGTRAVAPKFVEVIANESTSSHACTVVVGHAELRFAHVPDVAFLGALLRAASGGAQ